MSHHRNGFNQTRSSLSSHSDPGTIVINIVLTKFLKWGAAYLIKCPELLYQVGWNPSWLPNSYSLTVTIGRKFWEGTNSKMNISPFLCPHHIYSITLFVVIEYYCGFNILGCWHLNIDRIHFPGTTTLLVSVIGGLIGCWSLAEIDDFGELWKERVILEATLMIKWLQL